MESHVAQPSSWSAFRVPKVSLGEGGIFAFARTVLPDPMGERVKQGHSNGNH